MRLLRVVGRLRVYLGARFVFVLSYTHTPCTESVVLEFKLGMIPPAETKAMSKVARAGYTCERMQRVS